MAEFKDDTLYGSSDTHMYMMEWEKHYMETCINLLEPEKRKPSLYKNYLDEVHMKDYPF